jgi:uncharacterized repeat protein (TIGR03803 family)
LTQSAPPTYTTLYQFQGKPDAKYPTPYLVSDKNGVLYGTAQGGKRPYGSVFSLTPPASPGGAWTETVIHSFTGYDGAFANSPLIVGEGGALYGTAQQGGTSGTGVVFRMDPPKSPGDKWRVRVLYSFTGGTDGAEPYAGLARDKNGVLYGTTSLGGSNSGPCIAAGCGVVFALTPPVAPSEAWTENVLYSFSSTSDGGRPETGVVVDEGGSVYMPGPGAVYELTPPASHGGAWSRAVIYSFSDGSPRATLTLGGDGALYGTTMAGGPSGGGAVFQLTPPSSAGAAWNETTLYTFAFKYAYPETALAIGPGGSLYGSTSEGGIYHRGSIFELMPPAVPGGSWRQRTLYSFPRMGPFSTPPVGVLPDGNGVVYGTTGQGGNGPCRIGRRTAGCGTVFSLTP